MKHVIFTVGRFNPPTRGHLKLFNAIATTASDFGCDYRIFTTMTHDSIRNPLDVKTKMAALVNLLPDYKVEPTINPFSACRELAKMGYEKATLMVGSDHGLSIVKQLASYIGHPDVNHNIGIKEVSGIVLFRESDDYSASDARSHAIDGNFDEFRKTIPHADMVTINELYHTVRRNLGILDG